MSELISRQAAIDKINERQRKLIYCFGFENDAVKIMDIAKSIITAIPPAQPEQKTGKWMVDPDGRLHCSRCLENPTNRVMIDGRLVYDMTPIVGKMKFCPSCGARMEVLSDE